MLTRSHGRHSPPRALLTAVLLMASTAAMAITPTKPSAPVTANPPTHPSAPSSGTINSLDLHAGHIVIDGRSYAIQQSMLALIDKRSDADGLAQLESLQPGMSVRFRAVTENNEERVVELWIVRAAKQIHAERAR